MENQLPPALHELIVDPETNRIAQQLTAHLRSLENQGVAPRIIARALARVLFDYCREQYDKWGVHRLWALKFIRETGQAFLDDERMTKLCENIAAERERIMNEVDPYGSA